MAALGELLIDCTSNGLSDQGNPLFEANPGGVPCNVLAMLCKLGRSEGREADRNRNTAGFRTYLVRFFRSCLRNGQQ